ncbi:hypothetical protein [Streptomyces sp. NPDC005322]|uniref:hypothetical protein n=1 Tax=Streptomyces sp. NPDC005322 TaxID=3157032 RepID=UPI0033A495DB
MIIAEDDAAALADGYPHLMTNLNLKDEMIAELVGGQRDVFTAACGDQRSGLHGPKGKPCPARPWVCLLCPLAVFAPRPWHTANLLRLKAFFSRQWQQMPAAQFMAVFGLYATRIQQVLDRFEPAVLAAAGAQAANRDHELPLRPEELTGWPPRFHTCPMDGPQSSPGPLSAVRPVSHCPQGPAVRSLRTESGTSPTSSGFPVQMILSIRQFQFASISDPRWRLAAKELVLAMLAPRHPAVAPLPRAYRTTLHLLGCGARLDELE